MRSYHLQGTTSMNLSKRYETSLLRIPKSSPQIVCSGNRTLGWVAQPTASNAYEFWRPVLNSSSSSFSKVKQTTSTGVSQSSEKLGKCECIPVSTGDWYLNCWDGISPAGSLISGVSKNPLVFSSTFPATCWASNSCPQPDDKIPPKVSTDLKHSHNRDDN